MGRLNCYMLSSSRCWLPHCKRLKPSIEAFTPLLWFDSTVNSLAFRTISTMDNPLIVLLTLTSFSLTLLLSPKLCFDLSGENQFVRYGVNSGSNPLLCSVNANIRHAPVNCNIALLHVFLSTRLTL